MTAGVLASKRTVFSYRVPLRVPVRIAGVERSHATGYLLREEAAGQVRWANAAPLDGYSRETVAETGEALRACAAGRMAWSDAAARYASVRWAMAGWSMHGWAPAEGRIPLARLIPGGTPHTVSGEVDAALQEGYRAVKIKVGGRPLDEDINLARTVIDRLPEDAKVRFDANRAWSLDQAVCFARAVLSDRLDYVEEPLADSSGYPGFEQQTETPWALDESLVHVPHLREQGPWQRLVAYVLKPSLIGGLTDLLPLVEEARRHGRRVVVSAMYESGIGIVHAATLAAAVAPGEAAGLDTYGALAADVLGQGLDISGGMLRVPALAELDRWMDTTRLEPWS
jgi:O-succinylbenzoate synthase